MLNEEQQIGMMLLAEGYRRENEDKSLITDRECNEAFLIFYTNEESEVRCVIG